MSYMDLPQMKWFHIRSVERVQSVEVDNLNLRRGMIALREADAARKCQYAKCTKDLREEVKQIKVLYSKEIAFMNQTHEAVDKAMSSLNDILDDKSDELKAVKAEKEILQKRLIDMIEDMPVRAAQERELEKLRTKLQKLREEQTKLSKSRGSVEGELESLKEVNSNLLIKCEALVAECQRAKSRSAAVELDFQDSLAVCRKSEADCRAERDETVSRLEAEISSLRLKNSHLEEENNRLASDASSGANMKDFAKFVLLKTEIVALKSQLIKARKATLEPASACTASSSSSSTRPGTVFRPAAPSSNERTARSTPPLPLPLPYSDSSTTMMIKKFDENVPSSSAVSRRIEKISTVEQEDKMFEREKRLPQENIFLGERDPELFVDLSINGNCHQKYVKIPSDADHNFLRRRNLLRKMGEREREVMEKEISVKLESVARRRLTSASFRATSPSSLEPIDDELDGGSDTWSARKAVKTSKKGRWTSSLDYTNQGGQRERDRERLDKLDDVIVCSLSPAPSPRRATSASATAQTSASISQSEAHSHWNMQRRRATAVEAHSHSIGLRATDSVGTDRDRDGRYRAREKSKTKERGSDFNFNMAILEAMKKGTAADFGVEDSTPHSGREGKGEVRVRLVV